MGHRCGTVVAAFTTAAVCCFTRGVLAAAAPAPAPAVDDAIEPLQQIPYPPLETIEHVLITTAKRDFNSDQGLFEAAVSWHRTKNLLLDARAAVVGETATTKHANTPAPYLLCTGSSSREGNGEYYGSVKPPLSYLRSIVPSESHVRVVSNSEEYGACYLVTAAPAEAALVLDFWAKTGNRVKSIGNVPGLLASMGPFPSALKLAPGLLDHGDATSPATLNCDEGRDSVTEATTAHASGYNGEALRATSSSGDIHDSDDGDYRGQHCRLATFHGERLRNGDIQGLAVELSPGLLLKENSGQRKGSECISCGRISMTSFSVLVEEWLGDLMSPSLDLHATNFWSDSEVLNGKNGHHLAGPSASLRVREWSRAANVIHDLSSHSGSASAFAPGDVCGWDGLAIHHADDALLLLTGIDHLLFEGTGAGGRDGAESDELQIACFMGLLSFLAARPEVLHIYPAHRLQMLNAAAFPNVQSATLTDTPLSDAGLDGEGEIIQVVDTGLDYSSCFFVDEDEQEVEHGHYFEEIGVSADNLSSFSYDSSNAKVAVVFTGGYFPFDLSRRKIVQYIDLIKADDPLGDSASPYSQFFSTSEGRRFPWISATEFGADYSVGHGTHTAGSAAGSTLTSPARTQDCTLAGTVAASSENYDLSCVGGCIDADNSVDEGDDLWTSWEEDVYDLAPFDPVDLDHLCSKFDCASGDADDGDGYADLCLGDDPAVTLADHGGIARSAKLAIFDAVDSDTALGIALAGNGIWDPVLELDECKLHSNSYGADTGCMLSPSDILLDDFMHKHPENLLIFAAGNSGSIVSDTCTIATPALAKNVLAVGSSTSGGTRITWTGQDGNITDGTNRATDIDTVSYFSSYGYSLEGRVKPEVVAPGDLVYSAAGDGTDEYSCRLWAFAGTSMSCPIVAGASALIRQYFKDERFYANDVKTRGFCEPDQGEEEGDENTLYFPCEPFSPSSATVKAMLINSANLMGGSREPEKRRGFGRIHLEPGMPLNGGGQGEDSHGALFVADSSAHNTSTPELTATDYQFEVDCCAGIDLRATLSWIDPPASAYSAVQLVHDLDLTVFGPDGVRYTMWNSGDADSVNVNERVIVRSSTLEQYSGYSSSSSSSGAYSTWIVRVWSKRLTLETQAFSLVVTGAIRPVGVETAGNDQGSTSVGGGGAHAGGAASSWSLLKGPVGVVGVCWFACTLLAAGVMGGL